MSIGLASGLVAGLLTFVAIGLSLVLGGAIGGGGESGTADRDAFGAAALAAIAGGDRGAWGGGATTVAHDVGWVEKQIKALFGERGARWFADERNKVLGVGVKLDVLSHEEQQDLAKRKASWDETVERLAGSGGGGEDGAARITRQLGANFSALTRTGAKSDRFQVLAAQILKGVGASATAVATQPSQTTLSIDAAAREQSGAGPWPGTVTTQGSTWDVTVYPIEVVGGPPAERLHAVAAVFDRGLPPAKTGMGLLWLVLGPLLTGFGTFAVANGFGKKVKTLAREIERLGSTGDPTRALRVDGAEASLVARAVERMVGNLEFRAKHDGADLDEVAQRERAVAEEIHRGLIAKNPPRLDRYEVETLFKPGFEIGGDHFEYFRIDDDNLGVILLDTNVRGLQAALVMAATRAYVRTCAPGQLSPAQVLREVNRHLAGDLPPGRHVTALYAVLNTNAGTATLASAGHLPLLVYRHATRKLAMVNPEGLALGMDVGPVFDDALQEGEIPIGVGDRIVLYTDGALKIQNADGEEYGEQRFYKSVEREAPKNSQAFVNFVGSGIDLFHVGAQQNDDITISTIKRLA